MTENSTNATGIGTPTVITVAGNATSATTVADLDNRDLGVGDGEAAVRPILEEVRLQWYNGLPTLSGKMAVGWHIKAGINPYLDETCEALAAQGTGVEKYLVQHKRAGKDGKNDPKLEWHFQRLSLIVIADGVLSPLQMNKTSERIGIAWGWATERDEQGEVVLKHGKPSRGTVLKLRAFVHELYSNGFYDLLPLTISGYSTDDMLTALYEQYRVLDAYAAYRRGKGRNPSAPYYTFSLPLVASQQVRMVGTPPDTSPIYPMVAEVPEVVDATYLAEHLIPEMLFKDIRDNVLTDAMVWSTEETARIIGGTSEVLQLTAGTNGAGSQDDLLVLPAHVNWIVQHYCHNNAAVAQAVCEKFGVTELSQLRRSQYQRLVTERQAVSQ